MWYFVEDIMALLSCSKSKAYKVIQNLSKELVDKGFQRAPAGQIQKKWFCERYFLDFEECERYFLNFEEYEKFLKGKVSKVS